MLPEHRAWRVRGVPPSFDRRRLADALRCHLLLQSPRLDATSTGHARDGVDNVRIDTLASDLHSAEQVATVRFSALPPQLRTLESKAQLPIDISLNGDDASARATPPSVQTIRLTIDGHFYGTTVLCSPADHDVDVFAVCGLGGHAFGSFVHKTEGHMWLRDSLPQHIPKARVMTYGYDSGLQSSTNFSHLGDFARLLRVAITRILWSATRPLILVGHSLGGLLIKEALAQLVESDVSSLVDRVSGVLFFGVPHYGMDIESLTSMVKGQPNQPLLQSLQGVNSQVLGFQERHFSKILEQMKNLKVFCFYETEESPTAAKVSVN